MFLESNLERLLTDHFTGKAFKPAFHRLPQKRRDFGLGDQVKRRTMIRQFAGRDT